MTARLTRPEVCPIRSSRVITGLFVVMLVVGVMPTQAFAATIAEKRAQAAEIQRQLDGLDSKLEVAVEDYDQALSRYEATRSKVARNKYKLDKLKLTIGRLQRSLDVRADSMYRSGPIGPLEVLLGAASFDDLATTWDLLNQWNDKQAASIHDLRDARVEAQGLEKTLEAQNADAKSQFSVVSGRKKLVQGQVAARKHVLSGVKSDIAALVAQAHAASTQVRVPADFNWPPVSGQKHTAVVQIARRYLGRPYSWGASGPGSFDCSGFTSYVYAQVGVSLSHSSRAQINEGDRVSRADLQPGDLVFFGSPIHHVGLYIGGGMMIHAPQTGDVVKISHLQSNYSGACRPR